MVVTCQIAVILIFFWAIGGVEGPHGGNMKNWRCCNYGNFGDNTVFTCLPGTEECDSFPERLDLSLAPNKTNEGVKNQWNIR